MTQFDPTEVEGTDLEPRDVRALTEYLTVLDDVGRVAGAPEMYLVVSQSGSEYLVDGRDKSCTCPDAQHRNPDGGCKHVRRVAFATGERAVPAGVDGVDPDLGEHVAATTEVAATDGGSEVIVASDDGEILDDSDEGDACDCDELPEGVPCWDCYRTGATFDK